MVSSQASFTSAYHPSGALASKALPNGASWSLGYDLADRVTSRVLRSSAGSVLSGWERLAYDDNDSKLAEHYTQRQVDGTTKDGDGHYSYDKLNRLTTSKHPLEPLVMPYALDDAGNVVTESGFVYTYTANRLTKRERFPQIEDYSTYDYDRFGNQTQEHVPGNVAATNTYDAASHSVTRNQDGFNISQTYDALDRMVRRSDSTGDVTLFFRDGPGQAIALETDGAGATRTTYTLDANGEALLSDDNAVAFPTGRAYYATDPRGNLTQLLDGAQNVIAVFGYDDFGKQKEALTQTSPNGSSTWDSRLRFQLAPRDGVTGQYAIGPRMFDPATYRFIGADQFVGAGANQQLQQDPLTGNRYLYAGSNPANLIDDGHAPKKAKGGSTAPAFTDTKCKKIKNATARQYLHGQACPPEDFYDEFGYWPERVKTPWGDRFINPNGECSHIKARGDYFDFKTPCLIHDYGYDLLRSEILGGFAWKTRQGIDRMFHDDMRSSCNFFNGGNRAKCRSRAHTYYRGVRTFGVGPK